MLSWSEDRLLVVNGEAQATNGALRLEVTAENQPVVEVCQHRDLVASVQEVLECKILKETLTHKC